jgi:serine/threonine-protein kinase
VGKYRLLRRLARGGFGDVFEAQDTLEGRSVALKISMVSATEPSGFHDFKREIQINARLEHPYILQIKNADIIDQLLVIAQPLGVESLDDRLTRRISLQNALVWSRQLLQALAHAHERHVIHCDVKPDNLILFSDGTIKLADFGLAKLGATTIYGSSSGTVGFMAPEQAMGRPSARSDVFSAGLVIYRMLTGSLLEWPFVWPGPGVARLRKLHPSVAPFLARAVEVPARRRYSDGANMLEAFEPIAEAILRQQERRRRSGRK